VRRGELEVAGGFLPCVVYGVVADMAVVGVQLRQLFGKGASIAVGEFPIPGGTISGIREKDSPGNQGFAGFRDASQRSWCGRLNQRRMGTRAGIEPLRIVTLYLCRTHNRAA